MKKTIYKYPFRVDDTFRLALPAGAQVLTVQTQYNEPCLWAEVDLEKPIETRTFEVRGTGHPMDGTEGRYINTFQLHNGALVFHVFESTRK